MNRSILTHRAAFTPRSAAGVYLVIATVYVTASSCIVGTFPGSTDSAVGVEIGKGVFFVAATTVALWWLLKRMEDTHERLARTLRQILDNLGDGVFVVRLPERVIDYVNPAAERMFGYEGSVLVGQSTSRIHVDEEHYERFDAMGADALARGQAFVGTFEMRRRDGEIFPTSHMVTAFRDDRGQDFSVSLVRDESENLLWEQRMVQAQRLDAIAQLTGGIAHDFNNQLSLIMGYADSLRDELRAGDSRRQDAERILAASERAARLTSRLLSFARQQDLELELIDVNELIRSLADDVFGRVLGRSTEVVVQLDAQTPLFVSADRSELERSLLNLAINARDAMPNGGTLTLEAGAERIPGRVRSADEDGSIEDWVTIAVTDTGVGIPSDVIRRIFEPFFSTKPKGEGTGLGLSGAYGFIKQSGGDIDVHSEEGLGTTFTIRLPRHLDG